MYKLYTLDLRDQSSLIAKFQSIYQKLDTLGRTLTTTNIYPHKVFHKVITRKIKSHSVDNRFMGDVSPWFHNYLIRFMEYLIGRKVLIQFYPFMAQEVSLSFELRYRLWLPRMAYYERKLGHRFFLEEAVHILHLGFYLRDASVIAA